MDTLIKQHEKGLTVIINRLNTIAHYLAEVVSNQFQLMAKIDKLQSAVDGMEERTF